jgi:hypothetical protein
VQRHGESKCPITVNSGQEANNLNVSSPPPDEQPNATSSTLVASSDNTSANVIAGTENQNTDMAHDDTEGEARQDGAEKKFTLFPKLAPEIRSMFWKLALPGRRYVSAYCTYNPNNPPRAERHCLYLAGILCVLRKHRHSSSYAMRYGMRLRKRICFSRVTRLVMGLFERI